MNYLSVCSGIEAASAAWGPLGWNAVGFSEIEPFPCSVLAHHYPDVPNYGDMTRYKEWDIEPGSIDVLVGGTPCQSFSVAGLRGGIEDARGNLALTFCGILDRFKPKWFIWENVPGVLSSWSGPKPPSDLEQGREWQATETSDFGQLMAAFSELGFGVAWRILDAQYWGIPQRRRRVFVVGCFGDWRRAAQVIFEPDCLSGNFETGRKSRKAVAALTATGVGTCGADDNQRQAGHLIPMTQFGDKAGTLTQRYDSSPCHDRGQNIVFDVRNGTQSEVSQTLQSHHSGSSLNTMPVVIAPALTSRPYSDRAAEESKLVASTVAYQCHGTNVGPMGTLRVGNGNTAGGVPFIAASTGDIAHCLNAGGMGRQDYETETMVVAFDATQVTSKDNRSNPQFGDPCHPLVSHGHPPAIAVSSFRTAGDGAVYDSGDKVAALTTNTDPCANVIAFSGRDRGDDGRGYGREPNVTGDITETIDATKPPRVAGPTIGVRRLSVTECERLQGFPDDYTNVPHRGKKAADGPRYKAIGNSMAVPVVRWLGERIMQFNV